MKMSTPLGLLLTAALIWTGCTPSGNNNAGTPQSPVPPEQREQVEKIADQEQILESVGLKFVITTETESESEITYVMWDEVFRQAWLDSNSANGVQLQIAELKQYLILTEAEVENEDADPLLYSKRNLAVLTLEGLE